MDVMNETFMKLFCMFMPFQFAKDYEYVIRYQGNMSQEFKLAKTENKDICAEVYTSICSIKNSELFTRVWESNENDYYFNKPVWTETMDEFKMRAESATWTSAVIKIPDAANDVIKVDCMVDDLTLSFALQTSITERNPDNTAKSFKSELVSTVAFFTDDREEYLFEIFKMIYSRDKAAFAKKFNDSIDDFTKADLMEEVLVGRNMQIRDYLGV